MDARELRIQVDFVEPGLSSGDHQCPFRRVSLESPLLVNQYQTGIGGEGRTAKQLFQSFRRLQLPVI